MACNEFGCDEETGCVDCNEFLPVKDDQHSFTVSCNNCGYSGSVERVKLHSCQIQEQGGRCEDFPACGHTDGDGCQHLPEHTSEYWMNMMHRLGDRYDELDQMGAWD